MFYTKIFLRCFICDLELFTRILKSQDQEAEVREQNQLRMLSGNPFDPNIQNQIEEAIR